MAFASRLKGLLNYYLDSRYVTDFAKLCELLVCDRIKSTLCDSCLQYVLSIESGTRGLDAGGRINQLDRPLSVSS